MGNFYGFREAHTGKLSLFDRNRRALFNGVAIIEPTIEGFCTRIDKETGYYIPPDIKGVAGVIGLDVFFTENELYAESVETVEKARYYFLASLYFLKAFNVLIDNIASMFDVEEVKIAKRDIAFIESRAEDFNKGVELLKKRIIQTDYEDEEYKLKKLAVLEDILFPINLALTDIPKSRLKTTINNLKDFKAFTEKELNPTRSLCVYEEDYYNETGLKEEDTDGEGA